MQKASNGGASAVKSRGIVTAYANLNAVSSAVRAWSQGVIGTLPVGFRPATVVSTTAYCESSGGSTGIAPVSIDGSGVVRVLTRGLTLKAGWMVSFCCTYAAA